MLIPTTVYTQMAGRAGREGWKGGDVIILGQTNGERELNDARLLAKQEASDIEAQLCVDRNADRYFLQCLVAGLVSGPDAMMHFLEATIDGNACTDVDAKTAAGEAIIGRLRELRLIEEHKMIASALGRAIASSSLSIGEGLDLKAAIDNLQTNLCLGDDVHLLYLCVPPGALASETTPSYENRVWQDLANQHKDVIKMITTYDAGMLERHIVKTIRNGGKHQNPEEMAKHDRELDRFYFAFMLERLIAEESIAQIVQAFMVTRGSIQALQMQAATFAGQSVRFCETAGSRTLGRALDTFRERLNFGVKSELLPLIKLPSCSRQIARLLVVNRVSGPLELSELTQDMIARILAQRRGEDQPFEIERELAAKLKEEATMVARSLTVIEDLESTAITNMVGHMFGRRPP
jgi:DNA polymerase theta